MSATTLESVLTCPQCQYVKTEQMPTDACQWFCECEHFHAVLKPKSGDCCVYCSYGTVPCPPIQEQGKPAMTACQCQLHRRGLKRSLRLAGFAVGQRDHLIATAPPDLDWDEQCQPGRCP